jgi:hypothetical protein
VEYSFLAKEGYLKNSDISDVSWEGPGRPDWANQSHASQ